MRTMTPSAPLIQGVASPNYTVNPQAFYPATRRLRFNMQGGKAFNGLGTTDSVQLRQTGIIGGLELRVYGTIVFGGTITGTTMLYDWPYNLIQELRVSANGQSNLVRARGITLRTLELTTNHDIEDNGISRTFNGNVVQNGTLSFPTDDWGTSSPNLLAPNTTVAATGTYTVDMSFWIPLAADPVTLLGAVFAQSSATNLTMDVQWNTQANLLTLGGSATIAPALNWAVTGVAFSIPQVNNAFVVPDLSTFHQIAEASIGGLVQGPNQYLLPGTGVGRRLMRLTQQVISSAAPLPVKDANFGTLDWAYGGSDVPEQFQTGQAARVYSFRMSGSDIGSLWGLQLWDFASQFALRDLVDEGATSDLRLEFSLVNTPTNGKVWVAQETLFAAPVGA